MSKFTLIHRSLQKLVYASLLFLISLVVGVCGYMLIEGYTALDALYMSVITFSTVGFTEVVKLSVNGKLFTTFYILLNLGIFAYTVSVVSSFLFEGELRKVFKKYIVSREVKKLSNHIIVCGFGKNGEMACRELHKENQPFVVIERDPGVIESFSGDHRYNFVNGNATLDETLLDAGVEKAQSIITALPSDADNVFITLTAKELNPAIEVVAKATETNSENKLVRAGASHVVMPDRLGGLHMANLITKPYVIEFLELLNGVGDEKLELEEVNHKSLKREFHNKSLRELDVRNKTGATILAYKDDKDGFIFNPISERKVDEGDVLIVLGNQENLKKFKSTFVED